MPPYKPTDSYVHRDVYDELKKKYKPSSQDPNLVHLGALGDAREANEEELTADEKPKSQMLLKGSARKQVRRMDDLTPYFFPLTKRVVTLVDKDLAEHAR